MKTRFAFNLWRHTGADENLFHLSREELVIFRTLCIEASK